MKRFNIYIAALISIFALTWTACTDEVEYEATPGVSGEGVFFPTSVKSSITLDGTEGSFELDVQRTKSAGAVESELTAEFGEEGVNVFSIPSKVSFADGETTSKLTVNYSNLVRGTAYKVTLTFTDGTPYSNSSLTFNILYPEEVIEEWEVVADKAVLMDYLYEPYGASNLMITDIVVEKEKNSNRYRFISPYDNSYFKALFRIEGLLPDDFVPPHIVLNGETFKEEAPGAFYIAPTCLGFQMVDGVGPKYDTEWNTFGSVAGYLSNASGKIPPTSTEFPLGTYDPQKKMFNFGTVYHQLGGYGYALIDAGKFTLYLDPALMSPDFDRDYTWNPIPDASGYFSSEVVEENWVQAVEQAEEDPTFYRFPSLYAEDVHIYFNYDAEKGTLTLPKAQPTGLTTFGNKVSVDGVPGECGVDPETGKFTFVLSFYLTDKDGNKTAELIRSTETFLWGKGPLDELEKGKRIEDYIGTWKVSATNGKDGGVLNVAITKADETTLLVQGLSLMNDYDDTMALTYIPETGFLQFGFQEVAAIQGYYAFVAPFNIAEQKIGLEVNETLIGGLTKDGKLRFVNNPESNSVFDAMVYLVSPDGQQLGYMSGYWNNLEWLPGSSASSFRSFNTSSLAPTFNTVEIGTVPRRTYNTELEMKALPVQEMNVVRKFASPVKHDLSLSVR